MNRLLLLIASALMLNGFSSFAQNEIVDDKAPKLIAGPMLSYIDDYHAQMWLLVSDDTKEITIKLENFDEDRNQELVFDITDPKSYNNSSWYDFHISDYNNGSEIPVVLTLEELIPDAEYNVEVYLDSVLVEEEMDIYTPRNYLADTYFLLGHNLNLSDEDDDGDAILDAMGEVESDFMVWMGNNIFFNDNEADSFKKMLDKYKFNWEDRVCKSYERRIPFIQGPMKKKINEDEALPTQEMKCNDAAAVSIPTPPSDKGSYGAEAGPAFPPPEMVTPSPIPSSEMKSHSAEDGLPPLPPPWVVSHGAEAGPPPL